MKEIGKSLVPEAGIAASRPEITVVCQDTNEITAKEEVYEALEKQIAYIGANANESFWWNTNYH